MGKEAEKKLKDSFKKHGVKFRAPRVRKSRFPSGDSLARLERHSRYQES
jgi:hypothetical protein